MKKLTVDIVISFIYFVFCSLWKASQHHLIYIGRHRASQHPHQPFLKSSLLTCDFSKKYAVLLAQNLNCCYLIVKLCCKINEKR